MRAVGWLCVVMVIGVATIARDASADEGDRAKELRRAIQEMEAEIAEIEATVRELRKKAELQRQLADVARRRVALEKRVQVKRAPARGKFENKADRQPDPFGRRVEARKKMERRVEDRRLKDKMQYHEAIVAFGEPKYVAREGSKKGKVAKNKASLEARVARLEAENKKLHAMIKALMHKNAHSAPSAYLAQPKVAKRLPVAARKVDARDKAYAYKRKDGGIEARLDRIESLLMQLLRGKRASSGVMRAPVPPAPPRRLKKAPPPPVRIGDKVFEVKETRPGRTVTYGVKSEPVVVKLRNENFDVKKRRAPDPVIELDGVTLKLEPGTMRLKTKKSSAGDVNAQIRMLEALLKQAEERMRALEKSLGK